MQSKSPSFSERHGSKSRRNSNIIIKENGKRDQSIQLASPMMKEFPALWFTRKSHNHKLTTLLYFWGAFLLFLLWWMDWADGIPWSSLATSEIQAFSFSRGASESELGVKIFPYLTSLLGIRVSSVFLWFNCTNPHMMQPFNVKWILKPFSNPSSNSLYGIPQQMGRLSPAP